MRIILASGSPRRKELLDMMGLNFEVKVSHSEEKLQSDLSLEEQSKKLAYDKAKEVFEKTQGDRVVIGSDTMVVKNGKIYGKPTSKAYAISMLQELKNSSHLVVTSLCVMIQKEEEVKEYCVLDQVTVYLKNMSEEEIKNWVEEGSCMDKAGSYAIQGKFAVYIDKIEGNYYTVMGLPIHLLYDILKEEQII